MLLMFTHIVVGYHLYVISNTNFFWRLKCRKNCCAMWLVQLETMYITQHVNMNPGFVDNTFSQLNCKIYKKY